MSGMVTEEDTTVLVLEDPKFYMAVDVEQGWTSKQMKSLSTTNLQSIGDTFDNQSHNKKALMVRKTTIPRKLTLFTPLARPKNLT